MLSYLLPWLFWRSGRLLTLFSVLSAQTAFSIKATQFFKGGLTYFGGQVSAQVSEAKALPVQAPATSGATTGAILLANVPVEEAMEASVPTPPPRTFQSQQCLLSVNNLCTRKRIC